MLSGRWRIFSSHFLFPIFLFLSFPVSHLPLLSPIFVISYFLFLSLFHISHSLFHCSYFSLSFISATLFSHSYFSLFHISLSSLLFSPLPLISSTLSFISSHFSLPVPYIPLSHYFSQSLSLSLSQFLSLFFSHHE